MQLVDLTGNLNSKFYLMVMFHPIVTQKTPLPPTDRCMVELLKRMNE